MIFSDCIANMQHNSFNFEAWPAYGITPWRCARQDVEKETTCVEVEREGAGAAPMLVIKAVAHRPANFFFLLLISFLRRGDWGFYFSSIF